MAVINRDNVLIFKLLNLEFWYNVNVKLSNRDINPKWFLIYDNVVSSKRNKETFAITVKTMYEIWSAESTLSSVTISSISFVYTKFNKRFENIGEFAIDASYLILFDERDEKGSKIQYYYSTTV